MSNLILKPYVGIRTAMFVKMEIPDSPLYFSNHYKVLTIAGTTYTALGDFMGITETVSELKVSRGEVTITLSGIPTNSINTFLNLKVKGAKVTVTRGIFDPNTGVLLPIAGNPCGKFKGIINNYGIEETWDGLDASNTITVICRSQIGMLQSKIAGRKTNPADEKVFYPSDTSMDRVPCLTGASLQFGGQP